MKNILLSVLKLKLNHGILLLASLLITACIYLSWKSPFIRALKNGERINCLIIGTDWVDYARHSDTLIFVSYDPVQRFLDVVSIPRDTRFTPPGYNFRKINEIYAYHFKTTKNDHFASRELCNAVEKLLQDRVTIDHYIQINYSSFIKLIDYMGGLPIEIQEPMHYDDSAGKLHIHFDAGTHHLDGKKALEYVRFRGLSGDVGRIFRQQCFIKALVAKWKNPYILMNAHRIVKVLSSEVTTDLSLWDILSGSLELKDLKTKNIRLAQLPGIAKRGAWIYDPENSMGLLNTIFMNPNKEKSPDSRVRVEIWNAAGVAKMAEKSTWILRQHGFDVIDWGNFSVSQKKTIIKDLTGDIRSGQRIAEILGCGEVITRYDEKRLIDISIILGEDCKIE